MPDVILHQWEISPFCGKVRKVLRHKAIPFTVVNYNGMLALKAARLSPAGMLPVLEHDGDRIQDSSAIAAFLEEKYPDKPLYPTDPVERARCRILEDWADDSLYWYELYFRFMVPEAFEKAVPLLCEGRPSWERWMISFVLGRSHPEKIRGQGIGRRPRERVEQEFFAHLQALETLLGAGRWLVGDHLTIADLSIAAQLDEVLRTSYLRDRILSNPNLKDWLARCQPG